MGACLRPEFLIEGFSSLLIIYSPVGFISKAQPYRTCPLGSLWGFFFFHNNIFSHICTGRKNVFPSHGTACWPGHPLCALGSWVPQGANKKGLEGGLCFLALGPQSGEENERKQLVSSFGDTSSRSSWGHTALSNMPPGDGCEVSETAPGLGSARKQPIPQATPPTSQPPQANPPKPTPLLPGSWNLLPRHEFQMNRGSHTGDRLSRLSGCAAHFLLLRVADASLSRCLGGRAGKAPPMSPRTEELPWPRRTSWALSQAGVSPASLRTLLMPRTHVPATWANLSLPSVQTGSRRLAGRAGGGGDMGTHPRQSLGPRESGRVTGQAFRGNRGHHSLLIFMTCIS